MLIEYKDADTKRFAESAKEAEEKEVQDRKNTQALNEANKGLNDALDSLDVGSIRTAINNIIELRKTQKLAELSVKDIVNTRIPSRSDAAGLYPIQIVVGHAKDEKSIGAVKYLLDEGASIANKTITYAPVLKTDISQAAFNSGIGVSRNVTGQEKTNFTIDLPSFARTQKNYGLSEVLRTQEKIELGIGSIAK